MTDIYPDAGTDGVVDIHKARETLRSVGAVRNAETRREILAEVTAGALLDIAASLRVVSAEAEAAMIPTAYAEVADAIEVEATGDDFFAVGDLVVADGMDEPGEIRGFGYSEGAQYADVAFASGADSRVWLTNLTRLVGDASDDEAMQEAAEATIETLRELNAAADAEGELDEPARTMRPEDGKGLVGTVGHEDALSALTDDEPDIDDDFDTVVDDPLAKLEARAGKGKKKGGKK